VEVTQEVKSSQAEVRDLVSVALAI
jgi:hypothetical protein